VNVGSLVSRIHPHASWIGLIIEIDKREIYGLTIATVWRPFCEVSVQKVPISSMKKITIKIGDDE